MKSLKRKEDLIKKVVEQIKLDVDWQEFEAIEELLTFCPTENLIAYLPEEDWKPYKHLVAEEYLNKEDCTEEIRTENAITNLITQFPNDMELGKQIRLRWQK